MKYLIPLVCTIMISACQPDNGLEILVWETNATGLKLEQRKEFTTSDSSITLELKPSETFQTITGIGGSFTESSAHLLAHLSPEKRRKVLEAYFGDSGARYSLTRTHMNSCDFSLDQYFYAEVPQDTNLKHFSIEHDLTELIPMILEAKAISSEGFRIISSPWTAPPWMKDNNHHVGGKLLPEYYDTWALFFSKYLTAYKKEGIDIWGFTVENEPHGNGNNWESMHYTPKEMTDFVREHLGPRLENDGYGDKIILGYDQNRAGLKEWVDEMYKDESSAKYFDGTAIHWYESTYEVFPEALQYAHAKAPEKYLIETEGCIDSEVPKWKDDAWYWKKEATDWGWDWAREEDKYLHPKYAPAHRYARDMIGCFNNWVDGWVDWNMVLDKQGGPNWFENWCAAPVLVDTATDEIYFTPLYYVMAHFSKYVRPGDVRINVELSDDQLQATAFKSDDGEIKLIIFNEISLPKSIEIKVGNKSQYVDIKGQAIQTILINSKTSKK